MYQPYHPVQPPPEHGGKGLKITLVVVAVVAALVAAGAVVFMLLDRSDGEDQATATASPTPTQTAEPTTTSPEPSPSEAAAADLLASMLEAMSDPSLVLSVSQEYFDTWGNHQNRYSVSLDGYTLLSEVNLDGRPSYTILALQQGEEMVLVTQDHVSREFSEAIWPTEQCYQDSFCSTPTELRDQVVQSLKDLGSAALASGQPGQSSQMGGTDVLGFTLERPDMPVEFENMGAVEVILWLDQATGLPFMVATTFDLGQLRDAMIPEEFWTWGQGIMANSCMNDPPEAGAQHCQAYTSFEWFTGGEAQDLLNPSIPPEYAQVEPDNPYE